MTSNVMTSCHTILYFHLKNIHSFCFLFLCFAESSDRRKESKDSVPELAEPSGDQQNDDDEPR